MSVTVTPSILTTANMLEHEKITPSILTTIRKSYEQAKITPNILVATRDANEGLGDIECHSDITMVNLPWVYQNPGTTDSLTREGQPAVCSFASKTGIAFCLDETSDSVKCFDIPAGQKEVWIKLDMYVYDRWRANDNANVFIGNGGANGFTGVKIVATTTGYNDGIQYYVNGQRKNYTWGPYDGFNTFIVHLVSDSTNGRMEVFYHNVDARIYSFSGNVNNGDSFEDLYVLCRANRALFSNIVISPIDYFPQNHYHAEPYVYRNIGTANDLIVHGETVLTHEMSRTGTAFYQTARVGCFGTPIMDEVWIAFDLYHKAGTSRFRCYADNGNNSYATGICLSGSTTNALDLYVDNNRVVSVPTAVQPNVIQSYIVHMKFQSRRVTTEVWVDTVKVIDNVYETVSVPALNDIQLQSDNSDNLFSNVLISNSRDVVLYRDEENHADIDYEVARGSERMIIAHADICRTSYTYRYENPGTADLLTVAGTTVLCGHASKTGVAFYQVNGTSCFDIPTDKKELWVKFDAYIYKDNGCIRCCDSRYGATGFRLYTYKNSTAGLTVWSNDSQKLSRNINNADMLGLHSFKLHLLSDSSNGRIDLYIDDDSTPYYSFVGNVQKGDTFNQFTIRCETNKTLISNVIISDAEPSITEDVPYIALPYRYENIGTAEGLATSTGVTIETNEKSNTGVAFYQTTKDIGCLSAVPMMDDAWIKFDLYHESGSQQFRAYASSVDITGIYLPLTYSNKIRITIGNVDGGSIVSIVPNQIQTYLMHVVAEATQTSIDVWIDGVRATSWSRDYATPIRNFNLQSDGNKNWFSNIVISNHEILGLMEDVEHHADIRRLVKNDIKHHADIMRYSGIGAIRHADIIRQYIQSVELHCDIDFRVGLDAWCNADIIRETYSDTDCHADIERNVGYGAICHADIRRFIGIGAKCHADTIRRVYMTFEYHTDIQRHALGAWHYDVFRISSDSIAYTHADTKRILSRELDGLGEGTAMCKRVDLGKEMTVGIGISIEGEGYAMIRTAGNDGAYTGWQSYIPCERLCRYIDARLHVRMAIISATMTIDKRTTSLTLSKHLAAGDNTVKYGETFYNVPVVLPTAIGDGLTAHVVSKAVDSCVLNIKDANNQSVEGDVDILIRGW